MYLNRFCKNLKFYFVLYLRKISLTAQKFFSLMNFCPWPVAFCLVPITKFTKITIYSLCNEICLERPVHPSRPSKNGCSLKIGFTVLEK